MVILGCSLGIRPDGGGVRGSGGSCVRHRRSRRPLSTAVSTSASQPNILAVSLATTGPDPTSATPLSFVSRRRHRCGPSRWGTGAGPSKSVAQISTRSSARDQLRRPDHTAIAAATEQRGVVVCVLLNRYALRVDYPQMAMKVSPSLPARTNLDESMSTATNSLDSTATGSPSTTTQPDPLRKA